MVASMAEQPHVLVVDDDAKIAAALRRALIYEGYQVEVAPDGQIALTRARERMPDLAILDIMMPGIDGLEVTRRLRAEGDVPILLLTAKDGTADRVKGLDSGADDYLVKPFAYEELLARVRALLRRRAPRARRTLRYADVVMDLATREVRRGDELIPTTAKEFDLLQHFMRNPGQVLRREQLLDAVWGFDFGASSNVVDVYVGYVSPEARARRTAPFAANRARCWVHLEGGMNSSVERPAPAATAFAPLRRFRDRIAQWTGDRTAFRHRIPIRGRIALFGAGVCRAGRGELQLTRVCPGRGQPLSGPRCGAHNAR